MTNHKKGKIYIVGAGPGDVNYLTVRGQQLLTQAQVLVYDALVDSLLLQLVPCDCQLFHVGKRGGRPSTPQARINQLLVDQCRQGKQVVRLKSGDPFIFGRSSSEIQALIAAECQFEVIPGISSALAAPLLAGIPLTDSVLSKCFAVVTAHQPEQLDWEALARIDTLAILMGGRHLAEIVQQLQRYGRSHQTPIALIRNGGRPQQQVWLGTLSTIVNQTLGISLSPVVIVVGEVVGLRASMGLADQDQSQSEGYQDKVQGATATTKALTGKTVLVTRSASQSQKFNQLLAQQGATIIEMPTLVITPPSSWAGLDYAIANLANFDWLILTSSNGVDYFFKRLLDNGKDARALVGIKIAVVGKKTAASLKQHNLQPDFIPPNFVADSLVEHFPESLTNKQVLFPRVETGGREVLVKELTEKGAQVVEVAAYESGCPDYMAPAILDAWQQRAIDIVTFASSKTVKNFYKLLKQAFNSSTETNQAYSSADGEQSPPLKTLHSLLDNVCIASIGPQTSESCRQLLGRVDVEAVEYTLEGLTEAIVAWETGRGGKTEKQR
ncbi:MULTISPECIES: uroporphyrinogen-III C-methyltransferase [Moorena]|uniref:uroporphyrinogen-III C-methyltransferase n=1 Tax=Moorena producens 3L TaxID=489825 RepID=F4XZU9_9CYAN|nr:MULTISPECIES: uroporphyrinogen-III C-methyltransferase [Moorena]EGJ29867.1 uroporphyrinogen-III synthase [Moorena producens 3L]NEP35003.1 uroporphyrinogen-III C-methyltransferase [Moorena sp. SIO3B2]NEP66774.1 uroporphyrinogen-III C-methyltransferase [Moorena sp. SIO3A5]NES40662.1 uroporphyrinogen-III C-methyltransferase [Moorena sp. SIO2C4]OLT66414.1 uroporphyrinogen-III C-methyltransferase [Moorena producens 3L]